MPADGTGQALTLRVLHKSARRARLRPLSPPRDAASAQVLADRMAQLPDVLRVHVRLSTGSIILTTERDAGEVLDSAEQDGAIQLVAPDTPLKVGPTIDLGLVMADMAVKSRTDGAVDLRTALALLLLVGAGIQLSRGRIAGPATTLAVSALSLLKLPERR